MTLLAYRYALDPTPRQERDLRSHAGAARVAFNWGLALVKANLSQREAERTYGMATQDLTPSISWSLYSLRKASKTCSECGAVKAKLALSERTYVCEACDTVLDRDVNAAVNLARLAGSGPDSNGRGADRKTGHARQVAMKRQPGTRQRDQTGTLPPQGESAA